MESLKINGAEKQFSNNVPSTVAKLLEQLGIGPATVVAELDGQIIKPEEFSQTTLRQGQSIELVRFMPGG